MTHPTIYQFMIGAGYNLPLGSLTNIETIKPTGLPYLYPPQSYGTYDPGVQRTRLNGVAHYDGFGGLSWNWTGNGGNGIMYYGGAQKLRTDYLNGQLSGTVTIYTPTTIPLTYARYNAVATMTKFPDSGANFKVFNRFSIRMSHLVAL